MPTTLERIKIWIELLEPIVDGQTNGLQSDELDRLLFDLRAMEKDLEQPALIFDRHITAMLAHYPGNNTKLAQEIQDKLSPDARQRLFCVLQDAERELASTRRKARDFTHAAQAALMAR